MDFGSQSYGNLAQKADLDVTRAHDIIKEKLPVLGQLDALLSLTFGGRPSVFIDTRSESVKFLESCLDEPDTKITTKPERVECQSNPQIPIRIKSDTTIIRYHPIL